MPRRRRLTRGCGLTSALPSRPPGFSGEYDGLLVAEEDVRSRRGNRGMKAMGVRKWPEEAAAARFLGTSLLVLAP
jgi:hypothetical protein